MCNIIYDNKLQDKYNLVIVFIRLRKYNKTKNSDLLLS